MSSSSRCYYRRVLKWNYSCNRTLELSIVIRYSWVRAQAYSQALHQVRAEFGWLLRWVLLRTRTQWIQRRTERTRIRKPEHKWTKSDTVWTESSTDLIKNGINEDHDDKSEEGLTPRQRERSIGNMGRPTNAWKQPTHPSIHPLSNPLPGKKAIVEAWRPLKPPRENQRPIVNLWNKSLLTPANKCYFHPLLYLLFLFLLHTAASPIPPQFSYPPSSPFSLPFSHLLHPFLLILFLHCLHSRLPHLPFFHSLILLPSTSSSSSTFSSFTCSSSRLFPSD